jgi:predicted methyltransferase
MRPLGNQRQPEGQRRTTGGVWELPPSLRGAEDEREAKRAIGESDRMTLRFIKPRS